MKNKMESKVKTMVSSKEKKRRMVGVVLMVVITLGIVVLAFKGYSDNSTRDIVYNCETVNCGCEETNTNKI